MTDALALGEKRLSLLEESARTTTYKPALLLALIDRVQEYVDRPTIPVRILAERMIELCWPQTIPYQTTGKVLSQSQTRGRATIVAQIESSREQHGTSARALPNALRTGSAWTALLDRVEEALAQWQIPRLQSPTRHYSTNSAGAGRRPAAGRSAGTEPASKRSRCSPVSGRR